MHLFEASKASLKAFLAQHSPSGSGMPQHLDNTKCTYLPRHLECLQSPAHRCNRTALVCKTLSRGSPCPLHTPLRMCHHGKKRRCCYHRCHPHRCRKLDRDQQSSPCSPWPVDNRPYPPHICRYCCRLNTLVGSPSRCGRS